MHHSQLRTYVKPAQATTVRWGEQSLDNPPHFAEVAMALLPAGELFEAAEHALKDIEAGKPGQARETLEKALTGTGQP